MATAAGTSAGAPFVPATAKGEATRAFLLDTASRVFAERGYTASTLNELIAASGLTRGAFYFYFRSKSELALAVLSNQHAGWLDRVHHQVLSRPSAVEQLQALIPTMLELIETDPATWSITRLTKELAVDPDLTDQVTKPMAAWVALVADIVRRGQADGDLRPGLAPENVATVLVGAFDGLKALSDVLNPIVDPHCAASAFRARAQTLLAITELALLSPTGAVGTVDTAARP